MKINDVVYFTDIDIAKQFVVDEMMHLYTGSEVTLVITFDEEPYAEKVLESIPKDDEMSLVEVVKFHSEEDLSAKLKKLRSHYYHDIIVFNSLHRLKSMDFLNHQLAELINPNGILHLSWPAESSLGGQLGYSELDIAKMVSDDINEPFDVLRKSDNFYFNTLTRFQCQRMSKFDFNLNFIHFDGLKSWHTGGADLLFGHEEGKQADKSLFYKKLYEFYCQGHYQARMATTVADFIVN